MTISERTQSLNNFLNATKGLNSTFCCFYLHCTDHGLKKIRVSGKHKLIVYLFPGSIHDIVIYYNHIEDNIVLPKKSHVEDRKIDGTNMNEIDSHGTWVSLNKFWYQVLKN